MDTPENKSRRPGCTPLALMLFFFNAFKEPKYGEYETQTRRELGVIPVKPKENNEPEE